MPTPHDQGSPLFDWRGRRPRPHLPLQSIGSLQRGSVTSESRRHRGLVFVPQVRSHCNITTGCSINIAVPESLDCHRAVLRSHVAVCRTGWKATKWWYDVRLDFDPKLLGCAAFADFARRDQRGQRWQRYFDRREENQGVHFLGHAEGAKVAGNAQL